MFRETQMYFDVPTPVSANGTLPSSARSADIKVNLVRPAHVDLRHTRPGTISAPPAGASRLLDVVVATAALIVFAPVMLICAAVVAASNAGPVLFRQQRVGLDGRFFTCLKFRTMVRDADEVLDELLARDPIARAEWARDQKLRNDPRIIGAGGFMRKASLDELPQLFNVLAGDMSIVGPRPIVASELSRYGRYASAYCSVRPGITGLWQIKGRSSTTYRRRVACDVAYSRVKSPVVDLRIIACTVPVVLLGRGAC